VNMLRRRIRRTLVWASCAYLLLALAGGVMRPMGTLASAQTATPAKTPPAVGTIKSISGDTLVLATDAGNEVKISLTADVKYVRVPPGSKDLREAVPIQVGDLQEGDRVLVRAKPGEDGTSLVASTVIAMKKADISAKQTHEREDWQRRGIGGLVKSTDPSAGVITIGTTSATGTKEVEVHVSNATVLRRYAPNSVKFDDAKPSSLAEIKAGDQLRARGTKSEDGSNFTAEEIITGAFRNIAGTVEAVDAGAGTLTVKDLANNKPVQVKITSDSQVRKLPQPIAQRIAARLKGTTPDTAGAANGATRPAGPPAAGAPSGSGTQGSQGGAGAGMGGPPRNGGGDIQQMLSRLPASALADFQKGDAVMIVATTGQSDSAVVAITVLGGVEPLLQASPQGQASILTPWTMGSGAADAAAQ
jgi:transcription antitermination factor NusG